MKEEWDELFSVTDLFGFGGNSFVDYFQHEEGGSKQVWDGNKGTLSSITVPNCFGFFDLLPFSLKPGVWAGPPLSAISVLRYWQFAEKVIFRRLLKNAQMQVELCEIPFAGRPRSFVQNAYMRSLHGCTPKRRGMRETLQMGVFQEPDRVATVPAMPSKWQCRPR